MKLIPSKIASYLVKGNNKPELYSIYEYCFTICFETLVTLIFNICIAFMLDMFWEYVVFIVAFKMIREYAGGIHLSTFFRCFISTNLVVVAVLLFNKYLSMSDYQVLFSTVFCSAAVIWISPVECTSKKLSKEAKKIIRKKLIRNLMILICIQLTFTLMGLSDIVSIINSSLIVVLLSSTVGLVKNKYETVAV
ncbi:accessory gene regulator B [Lachnospiraceae bacterium PM6-15]|uniref:accessory gene regulator B family protein n=1 Tax=Ohessyouella blattaphilus TaxID=2949333 RepID=UPI003E3187A2